VNIKLEHQPYYQGLGEVHIEEVQPRYKIDPDTGEKIFIKTGKISYKTGKPRLQESTQMAEVKDAFELSSGTAKETVYAQYANKLKALANEARKESVAIKEIDYNPNAAKTYRDEVESLNGKLAIAISNSPKERMAMRMANSIYDAVRADNPSMTPDQEKRERGKAINRARAAVGAKKKKIEISDKEWEAIQNGAITKTKLEKIINNADLDSIRAKAMPKAASRLSNAQNIRIKSMAASGNYTLKEIADEFGVSVTTISKAIKGGE